MNEPWHDFANSTPILEWIQLFLRSVSQEAEENLLAFLCMNERRNSCARKWCHNKYFVYRLPDSTTRLPLALVSHRELGILNNDNEDTRFTFLPNLIARLSTDGSHPSPFFRYISVCTFTTRPIPIVRVGNSVRGSRYNLANGCSYIEIDSKRRVPPSQEMRFLSIHGPLSLRLHECV